MSGRRRRRSGVGSSGFTLLELVLVVAIIGVVVAVGWGMVDDLLPRYRTRQAAMDFASTVERMRVEAITNNLEHAIYLAEYDSNASDPDAANRGAYWRLGGDSSSKSSTWEFMPVDALDDGSDDDVSEGVVDLSSAPTYIRDVSIDAWSSIGGPIHSGVSNSDHIVFSPRGWLTNPAEDFSDNGYITVRFVNKHSLRRGDMEYYDVRIARSGFTRIDYKSGSFPAVSGNTIGVDERTSETSRASTP